MTVDVAPNAVGWYAVIPSLPLVAYAADPDVAISLLCDLLDTLKPPTPALH